MPIKYLSQSDAKIFFANNIIPGEPVPDTTIWNRKCHIIHTINRSTTARMLLQKIGDHQETISVIFVTGGKSEFMYEHKTIVYDLKTHVQFAPLHLFGKAIEIPFVVGFYHELGHAKQYLDDKDWYLRAIELCKCNPVRTVTKKRGWGDRGEYTEEVRSKSFFEKYHYLIHLESDNLRRHEWPICDELGFPNRARYPQQCGTLNEAKQQYQLAVSRFSKNLMRVLVEKQAIRELCNVVKLLVNGRFVDAIELYTKIYETYPCKFENWSTSMKQIVSCIDALRICMADPEIDFEKKRELYLGVRETLRPFVLI